MTLVLVLAGVAALLVPVTIVVGLLEGHGLVRLRRPARRRIVPAPQPKALESSR
jgi:hypothetical protein